MVRVHICSHLLFVALRCGLGNSPHFTHQLMYWTSSDRVILSTFFIF
jgi:hypothetical protein